MSGFLRSYLIIFMTLAILTVPLILADDFYYNDKDVKIQIGIDSKMKITGLEPDSVIDYVKTNLELYPKEDSRQNVIAIETNPMAKEENDTLIYKWDNPLEKELYFMVNSSVETHNKATEIRSKVSFPINKLPEEYIQYTKPTNNINSNDEEIIRAASYIAEGETDLYVVVNKIGEWVEANIKYSLDTLTADVSQNASWVFKNKYGVCDELTTLFIAMLRSLGIPARYISGVAYTNWNNINDFQPHAWAEVYFPDYGWVTFDLTYREFGYVDPTHLKMKASLDSGESSTKYEWKGYNIDDTEIKAEKLNIKTKVIQKSGKVTDPVLVTARAVKENVGFGSYNLIEAEIKNQMEYYISTFIMLSKTQGIESDNPAKNVLLAPNENKKIFFIIKIGDSLDGNYRYTFPVSVYNERNISSTIEFSSSFNDPVYTKEGIEEIIEQNKNEDEKVYSKNVNLECSAKDELYDYEKESVNCTIKNTGNIFLDGIRLCLERECKTFDLGISQLIRADFTIALTSHGKKEVKINAKNKDISKSSSVNVNVLDKPEINIDELKYPANLSFDEEYPLSFVLKKQSLSLPKDVQITLKQNSFSKEWKLNGLDKDEKFIIYLKGDDLNQGNNNFKITVGYKDNNNINYTKEDGFAIQLNKLSLLQKIQVKLSWFGLWFASLFGSRG